MFAIAKKHGINIHTCMYADDTQLYLAFDVTEEHAARLKMDPIWSLSWVYAIRCYDTCMHANQIMRSRKWP